MIRGEEKRRTCGRKRALELYLHIPFCVRKCGYCDFLSFSAKEEQREAYVKQLCQEIQTVGESVKQSASEYEVVTLFFGGGTPSVLEPEQIQRILDVVRAHFDVREDAEISMEMNPGTLGEGQEENSRLLGYKNAGINRVSLGLQSADNAQLRILGRIHTWEQFLESFRRAREAGFSNINIDLMSALPGQTEQSWESSLRLAAELGPEHISAYSLIIEEGTPFYERYTGKGEKDLPDEDTERKMYERTGRILEEYGFSRYEISNYAKVGKECRHNLGYWTGVEYLGFGLGASSYYNGYRFANTEKMALYMRADMAKEDALSAVRGEMHFVTEKEAMEEFMFLGLRLMAGVSLDGFEERFGRPMEAVYGEILKKFCGMGLLEKGKQRGGWRYWLTEDGISVSNQVMCEFLDPEIGPFA
ncbi:MAG: radical SAM family heme chaperone HemW [bacterium]|nr:radical SAM family heme chaperone HemW [bacterium]